MVLRLTENILRFTTKLIWRRKVDTAAVVQATPLKIEVLQFSEIIIRKHSLQEIICIQLVIILDNKHVNMMKKLQRLEFQDLQEREQSIRTLKELILTRKIQLRIIATQLIHYYLHLHILHNKFITQFKQSTNLQRNCLTTFRII